MRERLPLIISVTALVVSVFGATPLGVAAYEAVLPRNSVGEAQLRKGAVTNVKLRGDAVTGGKVKNGSLRLADFGAGQVPAGPKGDKGDKGEAGASGATSVVVRRGTIYTTQSAGSSSQIAECQPGETAVGGGGGGGVWTTALKLTASRPSPNGNGAKPTGWVAVFEYNAANFQVYAFVLCASP